MTTSSPGLTHDNTSVLTENENGATSADSRLFYLLLQLDCLPALFENSARLTLSVEQAMQSFLRESLSTHLFGLAKQVRIWFSLSSFIESFSSPEERAVLELKMTQFILSKTSVVSLFEEDLSWSTLQSRTNHVLVKNLTELNAQEDLMQVFSRVFIAQRNTLIKEILLKALPSIVLLISTLIALVMAAIVGRSLIVGH